MSSARTIIKNSIANGAGLFCEAAISFCMLPYIIHRLGDSAYGVWAFAIAVSGYMGILNLGFRPAINKFVAQYNATNDWKKIKDLIQASLFSYSICALLILLICGFLSFNVNTLFKIPIGFQHQASILVALVGVQMSIGLLAVVFGGIIAGLQRYEINNGIEIFVMISRTAIILLFLNKYPSLMTLAAAHFSMTIIGYIITVVAARRISDLSGLKLFKWPDREAIKIITSFGAIAFVISTVGRIVMYIDSPLIAAILSTQAVTFYTLGNRLIKYLNNFIEVLSNVLAPATSDLHARNKLDKVAEIFIYSSKISSLIVFPIIIFLFFWGRQFLLLWIGKDYVHSYHVMCVLGTAGLLYLPQLSTVPILYGTAKHKIIMQLSIASAVISLIAAISLGKLYGVVGVAAGLGVPQSLFLGIICPIYVCKMINLSYGNWFIETYVKTLTAIIPFALIQYGIKLMHAPTNWFIFIMILVGSGIFYLCVSWFFVISKNDKERVYNLTKRFRTAAS